MPLTSRLKIDLSFGTALLLLVLVGLLVARNVRETRRTQEQVVHIEQVLRAVESVESRVKEAEAAQRGYLITAQEEFLVPYREALAVLPAERAELRALVSGDPEQLARLAVLDSLIDRRLALLERLLDLVETEGFARAEAVLREGEGLRVTVALVEASDAFRSREFAVLQRRQAEVTARAGVMVVLALLGSGLVMLLAAASRQSIVRGMRARERAEAELQRREERFRVLVESASDIIYTADGEGCFTYVNPVAVAKTGFAEEELLGTHYLDLVQEEWRERTGAFYQAQVRDRIPSTYFEFPVTTRDGRTLWLGQNLRLFFGDGGYVGAQAVARDITHQLEVERMKDEFLSVVSHELRTPLTAIRGSLGLLAGGMAGTLEPRGQRMLEIAAQNTDRLVRLINDLLDIEKIESGKAQMEKVEVDLARVVADAMEPMQPLAEQAGVHLEVEVPHAPLLADPDRLVQVMTNLVSNAIKFSGEGGVVTVRGALAEGEVEVSVSDTGRGIPPDKLETVFERFQQVDSSDARQKGGTGLGLPIARSIVQQHGGRIWAESRWGEGSTFRFTLPRAGREDAVGPLVLVCDDDPGVSAFVRTVLQRAGFRVAAVARGEEAVAAAREQRPAAIVLDVGLPGMPGGEVVARLRADPDTARLPVVMVTATEERDAGIDPAEVVGWVEKPIDREALLRAVESAVTRVESSCDVLVAEDDPDLARVVTEMLHARGLTTCVAHDGAEAIEISRRLSFDLLVLDPGLPRVDGYGVVDWMRRHNRHRSVPVLVYTASDLDEGERERLRLGPTEFMTKARSPLDLLQRRVESLLGRAPGAAGEG